MEVVQTLVGSIGLVASVPLTTALACWVVTRARPVEPELASPLAPGSGVLDAVIVLPASSAGLGCE